MSYKILFEYNCNPSKYMVMGNNEVYKVIMNGSVAYPILPIIHIIHSVVYKKTVPAIQKMKKNIIYDNDGSHNLLEIIQEFKQVIKDIEFTELCDEPNAFTIKFDIKQK